MRATAAGEGAPGDLPAGNYRITDNQVWANNMSCPSSPGLPASGIGIALAGVHDTLVLDNKVSGIVTATASVAHGGIVIFSTKSTTGADPAHNTPPTATSLPASSGTAPDSVTKFGTTTAPPQSPPRSGGAVTTDLDRAGAS